MALNILSPKPIQELYCDIDYPVTAISFPEKSKFVAAGYANGVIAVFDVKLGFTRYTVTCSEVIVLLSFCTSRPNTLRSRHP